MTEDEIEAGLSEKGGFTRKTLEGWGVDWPPQRGWKKALLREQTEAEALKEAEIAFLQALETYIEYEKPGARLIAGIKALVHSRLKCLKKIAGNPN